MSTARIAPLSPPYSAEVEASLRKWMPPGSAVEPLALFRTLARYPLLDERLRRLGSAFLGHGTLPMRARELAILRTCARCGAVYEWGVHASAFGAAAGLDESTIRATTELALEHAGADALVLRAVDELHDRATLEDATWAELAARFGDDTLVELVALVGFYHLVSFLVNALGVEHEPWATQFPVGATAAQVRENRTPQK